MARRMRSNGAAETSKKLHILQGLPLANSRYFHKNHAVRRNSIMLGYLLYICKLKLRLEVIRREYMKLTALRKQYLLLKETAVVPEVMVKKVGKGYYEVKVTSKRKENMLIYVLEAFEGIGLDVLQAKVSSEQLFSMDAILVGQDQQDQKAVDASVVTRAILKALERCE